MQKNIIIIQMETNWKKYLKNNGGIKLIIQYIKNGVFFTALNQFIYIGKSKKALEILRLSVDYKFYCKIKRKYRDFIRERLSNYDKPQEAVTSNPIKKIWICWWQGIENAPDLVKQCYKSVKRNFEDWEIVVITNSNYSKYVVFPDYIIDKWKKGIISNTHMSDLLRVQLLIKFGGLWLDATIYSTSSNIPKSILDSNLFVYQTLKPGANGHIPIISNWLIYSKSNNNILKVTRDCLFDFWKKKSEISHYFLFHYFFTLACEILPNEYKKIPKFSNEIPHILLLDLFEKFNQSYWNDLNDITCFHKLSYKNNPKDLESLKDTYYNYIMTLYE